MLLFFALACSLPDRVAEDQLIWDAWAETPISLSGVVRGPDGPLVADVTVQGQQVTTDSQGRFRFDTLDRSNTSVRVVAAGHHTIVRSAWLARTTDVTDVEISLGVEPIEIDVARLLFGGDVMFGRRFVDVDGETPRDEPYPQREDALIPAATSMAGAVDAMARITPLLQTSDITSVNFESPVIRIPRTPHPEKDFVFYSDPETLPALAEAGVDFVGLGNNHVYDYLEDGLEQTLRAVEDTTLAHAGAGPTVNRAWEAWRTDVRNVSLAYHAATSIDGWRWDPAVSYVAETTKGGAANLGEAAQMRDALVQSADAVQVVQVHTGVEYAVGPTSRVREHVDNAIESGADLVIGHHPHTAQGLSEVDDVLVAWSLGNLAFDGLRLETLLGALVEVDMGQTWERARVHPVYLEDFRPRAIVGPDASRALRHLSEFSEGLMLVEEASVGRVVRDETVTFVRRSFSIDVTAGEDGLAVVDLRDFAAPDESVLRVDINTESAELYFGRDIMGHGHFEDEDVDEDRFEMARWDHTANSVYPCTKARSGLAGLCSTRSHLDADRSILPFRNRIRVFGDAEGRPEKDLSLLGWHHSDGGGDLHARVEFHPSFGEVVFGETIVGSLPGGDVDWSLFRFDFQVPDDIVDFNDPEINPRAIRLFWEHDIPRVRGQGVVALDDLAVVGWSNTAIEFPVIRSRAHASDFLKIRAPSGTYTLDVEVGRATSPL